MLCLRVQDNRISSLPALTGLPRLSELNLAFNRLHDATHLVGTLSGATGLRSLQVRPLKQPLRKAQKGPGYKKIAADSSYALFPTIRCRTTLQPQPKASVTACCGASLGSGTSTTTRSTQRVPGGRPQ